MKIADFVVAKRPLTADERFPQVDPCTEGTRWESGSSADAPHDRGGQMELL